MPENTLWVTLYNPAQQASHRIPDDPTVVQDFRDRGWETPDDTAARLLAEAAELHGQALDQALDDADLPKSGTVAEKQARLAEAAQQQVHVDPTDPSVGPTEGNSTTTEEEV